MTLRRVTAVASDHSRRCYRKAAVGFRMLRDNPAATRLHFVPSSFDYDVTSRRGKQVTIRAEHRTRRHCALSAMLTVSQLPKSFAGRPLFDDVSLQVNRAAANG